MRAVFFNRPGGVEVLQYGEVPTPQPEPEEVLIRVRACALNRLDLWIRQGARNIKYPHILGSDVSGVLQEVNGKSSLSIGQEVIVNPAIPCGKCSRCLRNLPCERVLIFGMDTQGGYAEYAVAPFNQIYPKPPHLSFVEAAAFPLTFLTAWHMLVGRADLQRGETVFVWGASGGLGTAAIRIANYLGARVIAAARDEATAEKLKAIGADEAVLYRQKKVMERVRELTGGKGVDVVFESVGAKTWDASLAMLCPYGRIVTAGATSGDMVSMDVSDLYVRQLAIFGARMGMKEEFETVLQLVGDGKLAPVVDTVFPLEKAAEAQRWMEEGAHIGKVVLAVDGGGDEGR